MRHRRSWFPKTRRHANPTIELLEGRALLSTATLPQLALSRGQVHALVNGPAAHPHHGHHLAAGAGGSVALNLAVRRAAAPTGHGVVPNSTTSSAAPYTPAQVRHAYGVDQLPLDAQGKTLNGTGQTIAIVDAYDDPTIASDLATFDQTFGVAAPPSFTKVYASGAAPAYNSGWAGEIALDVEWAHAIAPAAKIMLVEANSSSMSDLMAAVDAATQLGANEVSMSWGGSEFSTQSTYDAHFNHPGVAYLASAGDSGAGVEYPAASPYVVAVGGTSLQLTTSNTRASETAWSGSGGGASAYAARPAAQAGFYSGATRGVPDVSYNADPNTGVYVMNNGSWYQVGGTSAGAPQWAGLLALANQGRADSVKAALGSGSATNLGVNQALYGLAGSTSYTNAAGNYYDVTSGSNGNPATAGYDLVTGLGSPVANKLVPALIKA